MSTADVTRRGAYDDATTVDADAAPTADDASPDEAPPVDAGPRGLLFDPCTSDAQCPATNRARCHSARGDSDSVGYPRGLCTRTCTRDSDCADGRGPGVCATVSGRIRQCMPACSTRADCRVGYACLDRSPQSWCAPFCVRDDDCGDGAVCDLWRNVCFAPPHTSTGGNNGAPCEDVPSLACKGYCQPEVVVRPTGYIRGQCFSQCVLPEGATTWPEVWRQVTCPDGSLCVPESGERPGHIAPCMQRCVRDSECRAGYACRHPLDTDPATNDGICDRINCNDGLHDCPTGYTCDTDGYGVSMSEPIGRCVASAAPRPKRSSPRGSRADVGASRRGGGSAVDQPFLGAFGSTGSIRAMLDAVRAKVEATVRTRPSRRSRRGP